MTNLDLNVNVSKARTILGLVSYETTVHSGLLLEDTGFGRLLTDYAHNSPIDQAVNKLIDYVNSNF